MRNSVSWFAARMERKLQANDYKGGWQNMHIDVLMDSLLHEVHELQLAIESRENWIVRNENIIDECADVSNYAMMIADICKQSIGYFKDNKLKEQPCNTK